MGDTMIRYAVKRLQRSPVPALGVLLFAVVLSLVLCTLERSTLEEQRKYEETFDTIPVTFTVTNLSGNQQLDLNMWGIFVYPFEQRGVLEKFVGELDVVVRYAAQDGTPLVGIRSTALSPELSGEKGTVITWKEGYGQEIFRSGENLCIVPADMPTLTDEETGEEYVSLYFYNVKEGNNVREHTRRLTVAGTYTGPEQNKAVYCPYDVCIEVHHWLGAFIYIQAIQGTLADNREVEALREAAWAWFAEPNPLGEKTYWEDGAYGYEYYPYALDIDDSLLRQLTATLETSVAVNRICTVLVLCLSAGAGLLIGFLMVRSRKREIALMRTLGTPEGSIFLRFVLEQMLCFALGIAIGGAYNRWQPAQQLWILTGVFFAGLTAALLIFLRKNLITTIKEDD